MAVDGWLTAQQIIAQGYTRSWIDYHVEMGHIRKRSFGRYAQYLEADVLKVMHDDIKRNKWLKKYSVHSLDGIEKIMNKLILKRRKKNGREH